MITGDKVDGVYKYCVKVAVSRVSSWPLAECSCATHTVVDNVQKKDVECIIVTVVVRVR